MQKMMDGNENIRTVRGSVSFLVHSFYLDEHSLPFFNSEHQEIMVFGWHLFPFLIIVQIVPHLSFFQNEFF